MTSTELDPRQSHILETCLEAIQSGTATLQECLDRYPAEAPLIQRELQLAMMASRLKSAVMADTGVAQLEARLRVQFKQQMKPATLRVRPARRVIPLFAGKWAAALLLAVLMAVGAGGGTVAASAGSLPGDTLYGVKRTWESVVVLVASLFGRADDIWLHLAKVRFEELIKLAETGKISNRVLEEFSNTLITVIQAADFQTTPDVVVFMMNAESQVQLALPVIEPLPEYERMATLLKPQFDDAGRLVVRSVVTTLQNPPAATPLPPSVTPTSFPTFTPTATDTSVPTKTPTNTPTITATSRFAVTATRTPSPVPSNTPTVTPSATPTMTFTPLPLRTRIAPTPAGQTTLVVALPPGSTSVPTGSDDPIRIRETQGAVYATQTAIARGTFEPTATPE